MRLSRIIKHLEVEAAFALAAAPGFVRAPTYRQSQPLRPDDVVIFILGCGVILIFGIVVVAISSRLERRK